MIQEKKKVMCGSATDNIYLVIKIKPLILTSPKSDIYFLCRTLLHDLTIKTMLKHDTGSLSVREEESSKGRA